MEKFKKAPVVIPTIPPTSFSVRLREKNERLIRNLERLEYSPFGFKNFSNIRRNLNKNKHD